MSNFHNCSTSSKRGNQKEKFDKRKKNKINREDMTDELFLQLDAENGSSPTVLIELNDKEWKRLKHNSIYVKGLHTFKPKGATVHKSIVNYGEIELGSNLSKNVSCIKQKNFDMRDENKSITIDMINVTGIKDSMFVIVTDKDELAKINSNCVTISSQVTPAKTTNSMFHGSNKVLLAIVKHVNTKDNNKSSWNQHLFTKLSHTKPNICVKEGTNNHFRSQGYISAWGNKALYGKSTSTSSVGQYVKKKPSKKSMKDVVENDNEELEILVASEVAFAVDKFKKYFPNIRHLIAPLLNAAYHKQNEDGDVNFKLSMTAENGLWQSELCVDAVTRDFHTEKDVSYTLISVPTQDYDNDTKKKPRDTIFLFRLNDTKTVGFKMHQKLSFLFCGAMVTHKQFSEDGYETEMERDSINHFYNIACYGNQRLYNHLRHSFWRELGYEE